MEARPAVATTSREICITSTFSRLPQKRPREHLHTLLHKVLMTGRDAIHVKRGFAHALENSGDAETALRCARCVDSQQPPGSLTRQQHCHAHRVLSGKK